MDLFQIKFHPTGRHKVATGSMDGLVCVFDLQQSSESDALEETLNAESGVVSTLYLASRASRGDSQC